MKTNYHKQITPFLKENREDVKDKDEVKRGHVINCERLNVRDKANSNSAIICVLVVGTKVVIENDHQLAEENGWFHITTEVGVDGFVKSEYIEVI